jgi:hypothetical protein
MPAKDALWVLTTVGFPVLQFNAEMKQFAAFSNVPTPAINAQKKQSRVGGLFYRQRTLVCSAMIALA